MYIDWSTIASVATAFLVAIGVWEIRQGSRIAQAQFEDSLDQQFRDLAKDIPVDALIGKPVRDDQWQEARELIYNYLDLCNEQVFLRKKRKIRKDTWLDWCAGIQSNLGKVSFQKVWVEVRAEAPSTFTFLERLEKEGFDSDPVKWR